MAEMRVNPLVPAMDGEIQGREGSKYTSYTHKSETRIHDKKR